MFHLKYLLMSYLKIFRTHTKIYIWFITRPIKFFALIFLISVSTFAESGLNLTRDLKTAEVTPHLSFYEDIVGSLTIEEVMAKDAKGQLFVKRADANFGVIRHNVWSKFELKNESSADAWLLFFPSPRLSGEIDLYIVSDKKIIRSFHQNDWQSFYTRTVHHRNELFPLGIPGKNQTIYFSIKPSSSTIELNASLHTTVSFIEKNSRDMLILGIYYGIMISMLIYNAFIYFAIRDRAYLYYVIYLLVYILAQSTLDGLFVQYIAPDHFKLWHFVVVFGASIAWPCSILFTTSLLSIKSHYPRIYGIYVFMIVMFLVPSLLYPFAGFEMATALIGLLIIINVLFSFVISLLLSFRIRVARYYFAATTMFVLGMVIQELKLFDIYIPALSNGNYSLQLGSSLEALLFSLALGYRINLMRQTNLDKEMQIKKLEFSNLQGKVNPHFLYNSLNMVLGMLEEDKKAVKRTVGELADIYEYMTYYLEKDLVLLKEEWQFALKYFGIMNKRIGRKYKINIKMDKNASTFMIPPLTLQTLVENCLKHAKPNNAAKGKKDKYLLTISMAAKMTENGLSLSVSDDGITGEIKVKPEGSLENIRQRLEYHYSSVSVTMEPVKTGGVKTAILISGRK